VRVCPNCKHEFHEEKIIAFTSYTKWREYISEKMHNAFMFKDGPKTYVQSNKIDGRILGEWSPNQKYGYVAESRHNLLKRITYANSWGSV
jgi:hypothetical protein